MNAIQIKITSVFILVIMLVGLVVLNESQNGVLISRSINNGTSNVSFKNPINDSVIHQSITGIIIV